MKLSEIKQSMTVALMANVVKKESTLTKEPSRGNEWGQLNQPRRSHALMVSAK